MPESTNRILRCRVEHTAAGEAPLELFSPRQQLEAWDVAGVTTVLNQAEAAAAAGSFVAGFVSYDAALALDLAFRVPTASPGCPSSPRVPLAWFGVFDECRSVSRAGPEGESAVARPPTGSWECVIDAERHARHVQRILGEIAEGTAYLVNLTTRFRRTWGDGDDPFDLYEGLIGHFSEGFHSYIDTEDWTVICGSPELFFELSGGTITTRPMKGTSRRGRWNVEDRELADRLSHSPKEQAENVMVVDMVRNDIGRIATMGSVAVPSMFRLEAHPSLWQMTSTVTGLCGSGTTLSNVFSALFPSASVTGTPKVSAMSLIADLEDSPRGIYCGAVGLLQPTSHGKPEANGVQARFAVAIRTAVIDKRAQLIEYGSGGGITSGSDPKSEWTEVLMKAHAIAGPTSSAVSVRGLIETMGFDPRPPGGEIRNLDLHLARLHDSAAYFGFPRPSEARYALREAVEGASDHLRVRLEFTESGVCSVTTVPLESTAASSVLRLCVDRVPVDPSDVRLFHKTTDRRTYDERASRHPCADDVILVNDRGELTETTRANLAVRLDGTWWTPPLSSGLLPGIERGRLLSEGILTERVLRLEELKVATAIATVSSLRGWREGKATLVCECRNGSSAAAVPAEEPEKSVVAAAGDDTASEW